MPTPTEERKCNGCNAPFEAHHHIHTTREGSYHTSCYKKLDHPIPAREVRVMETVKIARFKMQADECLPLVKGWNGSSFDVPFDHGYEQARKDILALFSTLQ